MRKLVLFCFNEMLLFLKSQFSFPHAPLPSRALLHLLNLIEPFSLSQVICWGLVLCFFFLRRP